MADQTLEKFFAYAPWVFFTVIIVVAYFATRRSSTIPASNQTFACAQCGRRGTRERMIAVQHEGAVAWYCPHCAATEARTAAR